MKLGDTVLVTKRSTLNSAGETVLESARPVVTNIVAVYVDRRVQVKSGDVWKVMKCNSAEADFVTVR